MTEHNMTREEAEAAARAGAKVRHEGWYDDSWVTFFGKRFVDEDGDHFDQFARYGETGWSIVEPAPTPADVGPSDTAKAETDARNIPELLPQPPTLEQRMADLEAWREEMTGHFHMTDPREDRTTTPAFATTRAKPQPYTPGPRQATAYMPNGERIEPLTLWRPTIGRDAVTRDGRKVTQLTEAEGGQWIEAVVNHGWERWYPHGNYHSDGAHTLDLIGDWVEPQPATDDKPHPEGSRKWAKWHMKRGRKVRRGSWVKPAWIMWSRKGQVVDETGIREPWMDYEEFQDGWQLVGDDQ